MAVTYNHDTHPDISAIRLEIGDTVEDAGVKPDKGNFSDEELDIFLAREGSVLAASAAALEVATRLWRRRADMTLGSLARQLSQVANGLATDAKTLRQRIADQAAAVDADAVGYASVQSLGYVEPAASEWA